VFRKILRQPHSPGPITAKPCFDGESPGITSTSPAPT
jgi:hypothetical protein